MFSLKRLSLLMLPAVLVLLVAACGDDPTPTPTTAAQPSGPTPTPTFAPRPTPTPTVTPTPAPAPQEPITWVINRYEIENENNWEVRVGQTDKWGYAADDRVNGNEGDGIVMTIRLGDSIYMEELRASTSGNTRPHKFTIVDLGIDEELDPGERYPFTITPEAVGEYVITDSSDPTPGEHGKAKIVVIEAGAFVPGSGLQLSTADFLAGREAETAGEEGIIDIDGIRFEDGLIELRIGPNPRLGYEANARPKSNEGDGWIIKLDIGDKLIVGQISQSGSRSTVPHAFRIADLGVGFPLDAIEGGGPVAPWTFTFFDEGVYAIGDAHEHGTALIVVGNPVMEGPYRPVVYTLDQIRLRDAAIELRIGEEDALGFPAGERVTSAGGNDVTITINAGDSLVFPAGFTGSSGNTATHFLTITELGIDVAVEIGNRETALGFVIAPTEPGTYRVFCSAHPDDHGNFTLVVNEPPSAGPQPVTYTLDQVRLRDAAIEMRMGDTTAWGYNAGDRVTTADGNDVTVTINAGDSLVFPAGITASSGNTEKHFFTIDELGIDIGVEIANRETALGLIITPTEAGTFRVYCSAHPDTHGGNFTLVVEAVAAAGPEPVVFALQMVRVRDDIMDIRMGETTAWGYEAGMRVESGPGYDTDPGQDGVFLTINLGDSISFERGINGSNGNTGTHFFTIDELGIDIELPPDGQDQAGEGFTIKPTEVGNLRVYCSAHPDDHGIIYIIVVDPEVAAAAPTTYALDKIRIRDDIFDVRMGETTAWGYEAGMRVESGPGHDTDPGQKIVLLTLNLGDSIPFEDGIDGSNGNADTHFFTIDDLGFDIELAPGTATDPGFTIKPTEAGNYRMYCSAHPDAHGDLFIIVR